MSVLDLPRLWRPETHQALFRRILDVAARPGQIADLSGPLRFTAAPLPPATRVAPIRRAHAPASDLLE